MTEKLKENNVTNLIFDPYNITHEHNKNVLEIRRRFGVDTVTMFNVLNVIKKREIQINVLNLALETPKDWEMVFIID